MKEIDKKLSNLGFKREREYIPHLTIGRVKFIDNKKKLKLSKAIKTAKETKNPIITEIKPASPSKGNIREIKLEDVKNIAKEMVEGGALPMCFFFVFVLSLLCLFYVFAVSVPCCPCFLCVYVSLQ